MPSQRPRKINYPSMYPLVLIREGKVLKRQQWLLQVSVDRALLVKVSHSCNSGVPVLSIVPKLNASKLSPSELLREMTEYQNTLITCQIGHRACALVRAMASAPATSRITALPCIWRSPNTIDTGEQETLPGVAMWLKVLRGYGKFGNRQPGVWLGIWFSGSKPLKLSAFFPRPSRSKVATSPEYDTRHQHTTIPYLRCVWSRGPM